MNSASSLVSQRLRVLFVGEAVTLAHVARPIALARALDPGRYDVRFAADPRFDSVTGDLPFPRRTIHSISCQQFMDALVKGTPLYDFETYQRYIEDDLALLEEVRPDVVVGDFRLSLGVSARVASVRYITILNAYWSPFASATFTMPEMELSLRLGLPVSRVLFNILRPIGWALHARPINLARKRYGLKSLGADLRRVYSEADEVAYADLPELIPTENRTPAHSYIGPVLWSPSTPPPDWWESLPGSRPIVYVTLGSSGQGSLLRPILEGLAELPVTVLAATAGRVTLESTPANAFVADYLPGEEAAARSQLVICNGGSPTTQQALASGAPVLGIPTNMDQFLNMEYIVRAGLGTLLRPRHVSPDSVKSAVQTILDHPAYAQKAAQFRAFTANYNAPRLLDSIIHRNGITNDPSNRTA